MFDYAVFDANTNDQLSEAMDLPSAIQWRHDALVDGDTRSLTVRKVNDK